MLTTIHRAISRRLTRRRLAKLDPMPVETTVATGQTMLQLVGYPHDDLRIAQLLDDGAADVVVANGYEYTRGGAVRTLYAGRVLMGTH